MTIPSIPISIASLSATSFNSDMFPRIQNRFPGNLPPRFRNPGCNVQPSWFLTRLSSSQKRFVLGSGVQLKRAVDSDVQDLQGACATADNEFRHCPDRCHHMGLKRVHYQRGLIERLRRKPWYPNKLDPLQHDLLIHPCLFLNAENALVRKSEFNAPKSHFSTNPTVSSPFENDKLW
jgi:hypothetical protein